MAYPLCIYILIVGLALGIAATVINYWYYVTVTSPDTGEGTAYFGLWKLCGRASGISTCVAWNTLDDDAGGQLDLGWIHACQASMIIGVILNALSSVMALVGASRTPTPNVRPVQGLSFLSGICYLIAAIVFAAKYSDSLTTDQVGGNLHAGFALAIAACVLNFFPACILSRGQTSSEYDSI